LKRKKGPKNNDDLKKIIEMKLMQVWFANPMWVDEAFPSKMKLVQSWGQGHSSLICVHII
jgi:hypothetical protein